jgi:hypothetical protein
LNEEICPEIMNPVYQGILLKRNVETEEFEELMYILEHKKLL